MCECESAMKINWNDTFQSKMSRIPCRPLGFSITISDSISVPDIILEVYVDFTCPFSAKMYNRLKDDVGPHFGDKLRILLHPMPQPWHPSSSMLHECFHAAIMVSDSALHHKVLEVTFANALKLFSDCASYEKSRKDLHNEMLLCYESSLKAFDGKKFLSLLSIVPGKDEYGNDGNGCTRMMKLYAKQHRQLGIHVTPTTRVNGIVCDTSSSWAPEKWEEFLDPLLDSPTA